VRASERERVKKPFFLEVLTFLFKETDPISLISSSPPASGGPCGIHGPPVERVVERDDVLLARGGPRELDRGVDRLGARVGEQEGREAFRGHLQEPVDEPRHGYVARKDVLLRVDERGRLVRHGARDARVAVARREHADARGHVEELPAVGAFDVRAARRDGNVLREGRDPPGEMGADGARGVRGVGECEGLERARSTRCCRRGGRGRERRRRHHRRGGQYLGEETAAEMQRRSRCCCHGSDHASDLNVSAQKRAEGLCASSREERRQEPGSWSFLYPK